MENARSMMLLGTRRYQVGSDRGRSIVDASGKLAYMDSIADVLGSRKFPLAYMDAFAIRSPNTVKGDQARAPEGIVAK